MWGILSTCRHTYGILSTDVPGVYLVQTYLWYTKYRRTWGILRGMEEGPLLEVLAGGMCLVSLCNMAYKINTGTIKTQFSSPRSDNQNF